jgi:hypothetical protein
MSEICCKALFEGIFLRLTLACNIRAVLSILQFASPFRAIQYPQETTTSSDDLAES